jgi:predicted small metal-binding protein
MAEPDDIALDGETWPQCDCGYQCRGDTSLDRVRDAQRHARVDHGIDVSVDQVLNQVRAR